MRIFLALTALLASATLAQSDIRTELAQQLDTSPDHFVMNLPPRGGVQVGTIYLKDRKSLHSVGNIPASAYIVGPEFDLASKVDFSTEGEFGLKIAKFFGASVAASDDMQTDILITGARIIELDASTIGTIVRDAYQKFNKTADEYYIVTKIYQGLARVVTRNKTSAKAEASSTVDPKLGVTAGAAVSNGIARSIEPATAIVFAFELSAVRDYKRYTAGIDRIYTASSGILVPGFASSTPPSMMAPASAPHTPETSSAAQSLPSVFEQLTPAERALIDVRPSRFVVPRSLASGGMVVLPTGRIIVKPGPSTATAEQMRTFSPFATVVNSNGRETVWYLPPALPISAFAPAAIGLEPVHNREIE
ncbi:hypothetical protein [Ancylobacter oerskovii]|uniref:Uncharacterized protein n=1 Tax=Ancylobacter oerskovii TaxID=459519 RepID=A0ABW4Z255_9HYPH|nr:hypothetical protein [Ancylobacter oerskovii]MBS7545115.1 hypothetical protein [Ancylobacter oerskovii]